MYREHYVDAIVLEILEPRLAGSRSSSGWLTAGSTRRS